MNLSLEGCPASAIPGEKLTLLLALTDSLGDDRLSSVEITIDQTQGSIDLDLAQSDDRVDVLIPEVADEGRFGISITADSPNMESATESCAFAVHLPDDDSDGVPNRHDACSTTHPGERLTVDASGCGPSERDSDGDRVVDAADECPRTPPGEIGHVDASGCGPNERDSDGDGFIDAEDGCPHTPPGEVSQVDASGCGPSERDSYTCPGNSHPIGKNRCQCDTGYQVVGNPEVDGEWWCEQDQPACPAHGYPEPSHWTGCWCEEGYWLTILDDGSLLCEELDSPGECPANSHAVGDNRCQCDTGYQLAGNPEVYGEWWCEQNQPVCPAHGYPEPSHWTGCWCEDGYWLTMLDDGSLLCEELDPPGACPANSHPMGDNRCQCDTGYQLAGNPEVYGEWWCEQTQTSCPGNSYPGNDGQCCPTGTSWNGTWCVDDAPGGGSSCDASDYVSVSSTLENDDLFSVLTITCTNLSSRPINFHPVALNSNGECYTCCAGAFDLAPGETDESSFSSFTDSGVFTGDWWWTAWFSDDVDCFGWGINITCD